MAKVDSIESLYQPRKHQYYLHKNRSRFNVVVTHRRFGKTYFDINETILRAANQPLKDREHAPPRYALIYPELKQGRRYAWDPLKYFSQLIPRQKNENDMRIDFEHNKARIEILGADQPDRIRSAYYDGVVIDEMALCPPNLWQEVLLPTLADFKGWAIMTGTPKGRNHFYDMLKHAREKVKDEDDDNWFYVIFPASRTDIIEEDQLQMFRDNMTEAQYSQEFECEFNNAVVGAYFREQMLQMEKEDRITDVPYKPNLPVDTCWDLGGGENMAIWCLQREGDRYRWIDFIHSADIQDSSQGMPAYFDVLRSKPYSYRTHYGPWDLSHTDIGSGKTRLKTARNHGFHFQVVPRVSDVMDRIHASRIVLSQSVIDEDNCQYGIEALQNYRREYDEDKQTYKDKPLGDWASHPADAFGTGAQGTRDPEHSRKWENTAGQTADTEFEVFA